MLEMDPITGCVTIRTILKVTRPDQGQWADQHAILQAFWHAGLVSILSGSACSLRGNCRPYATSKAIHPQHRVAEHVNNMQQQSQVDHVAFWGCAVQHITYKHNDASKQSKTCSYEDRMAVATAVH